jgi:mannose-6-phosphate isomerase-like protein (cupin superfamily)
MKLVLAIATLLGGGILLLTAAGTAGVVFLDHGKVAAAMSKGGTLAKGSDYIVLGSHRDKPGQVEIHDKETDVMYMLDGEATVVTGGTPVGMKATTPGQSLGTDIKGGEAHHLVKGDIMVIPAGTPHWFKEVKTQVSYYVVKVVKP